MWHNVGLTLLVFVATLLVVLLLMVCDSTWRLRHRQNLETSQQTWAIFSNHPVSSNLLYFVCDTHVCRHGCAYLSLILTMRTYLLFSSQGITPAGLENHMRCKKKQKLCQLHARATPSSAQRLLLALYKYTKIISGIAQGIIWDIGDQTWVSKVQAPSADVPVCWLPMVLQNPHKSS